MIDRVRADGDLSDGPHPQTLVNLAVTYEVEGDIAPRKLWRAINLSQQVYCGVSAMVRAHGPIEVRVFLNGEELPNPATG